MLYLSYNNICFIFCLSSREFRLVLRQDPLSVFSSDVVIENSDGPMDYDISRIYTGSLEGKFEFSLNIEKLNELLKRLKFLSQYKL